MPGQYIDRTWRHRPTLYAPAKYRRACRYRAFLPDPLSSLQFSLSAATTGVISEAEASIHALNADAHPALVPLARLLLRTESIASSRVEGIQMGIRGLARAEARLDVGGRQNPTAREILANIAAMQAAIHEGGVVGHFGIDEILSIHRRLMEQSPRPEIAGRVRTEQNWIGGNDYNPCGADFVPPPPEEVRTLLADLCRVVNRDELPPIVQAALVHAQFETIHPFDDGNGRTGRALIHVVLRRRKLAVAYVPPISVVLAANRDRYIDGLLRFRGDTVSEWVEDFAASAARSAHLAQSYVKIVQQLVERWRQQLAAGAAPRARAAAWAIIDILPAYPMITAPVATAVTGRAKAATYQALAELQNAGVLTPILKSGRSQAWEAVGLLDVLAGLEAGRFPTSPARATARTLGAR